MKVLLFNVRRDAYAIEDVVTDCDPITVGDLKVLLEQIDDDVAIICSHDNGYTYGSLSTEAYLQSSVDDDFGTEFKTEDVFYV